MHLIKFAHGKHGIVLERFFCYVFDATFNKGNVLTTILKNNNIPTIYILNIDLKRLLK